MTFVNNDSNAIAVVSLVFCFVVNIAEDKPTVLKSIKAVKQCLYRQKKSRKSLNRTNN